MIIGTVLLESTSGLFHLEHLRIQNQLLTCCNTAPCNPTHFCALQSLILKEGLSHWHWSIPICSDEISKRFDRILNSIAPLGQVMLLKDARIVSSSPGWVSTTRSQIAVSHLAGLLKSSCCTTNL